MDKKLASLLAAAAALSTVSGVHASAGRVGESSRLDQLMGAVAASQLGASQEQTKALQSTLQREFRAVGAAIKHRPNEQPGRKRAA